MDVFTVSTYHMFSHPGPFNASQWLRPVLPYLPPNTRLGVAETGKEAAAQGARSMQLMP